MKNFSGFHFVLFRLAITLTYLHSFIVRGAVPLNPKDPSLRLWLKADDLEGPTVSTWKDASGYGTIFSVPPLPPGDKDNDPQNHTPILTLSSEQGHLFKAVQFRQVNDPIVRDPKTGHLSDRLWQINNLDLKDPTAIGPESDLTFFIVYKEAVPGGLGQYQTLAAKRGSVTCPYDFAFEWNGKTGSHVFINYSGDGVYASGLSKVPVEWGLLEVNLTTSGQLTFKDYYSSLGGWRDSEQTGVGRTESLPGTPFTLGFHIQGVGRTAGNPWGAGAYERFVGSIAEVILYSRTLPSDELSTVENYLLEKYLSPGEYSSLANSKVAAFFVSAVLDANDHKQVILTFSEPVSAETAANAANYFIPGDAVSIVSASMSSSSNVVLALSAAMPDPPDRTLVINGVKNLEGQLMLDTNSMTPIVGKNLNTIGAADFNAGNRKSQSGHKWLYLWLCACAVLISGCLMAYHALKKKES